MDKTLAWVIDAVDADRELQRVGGDASKIEPARIWKLTERVLPQLGPRDVKLEILAVSAEHNVLHALRRDFIDILRAHGGVMSPGNSAIAVVTDVGCDVTRFKPGEVVSTQCSGQQDRYGYPERIWAFDMIGSVGWYAEHAVVADWQLIHLPIDCGLSLWELAAMPLRAPTAYHLWRRALGMYRVKVSSEQRARVNVLAFGGGVSELFLMLAKAEGHAAYFCSGSEPRLQALAARGIAPIDQRTFNRFADEADIEAFRTRCRELTGGGGMDIVCDMLRGPVFAAGLAVAAREGVNISAGWQLGQDVRYNSASLAVRQISIDHVHYETIAGCKTVTELFGSVLQPMIHDRLYAFEELPLCFEHMLVNQHNGIPIIRVARELPPSVRGIAGAP